MTSTFFLFFFPLLIIGQATYTLRWLAVTINTFAIDNRFWILYQFEEIQDPKYHVTVQWPLSYCGLFLTFRGCTTHSFGKRMFQSEPKPYRMFPKPGGMFPKPEGMFPKPRRCSLLECSRETLKKTTSAQIISSWCMYDSWLLTMGVRGLPAYSTPPLFSTVPGSFPASVFRNVVFPEPAHSGNVQGTFSEQSGNVQETLREHSGNIQGELSGRPWASIPTARST
jgi:hypothetical protein